MTASRPGALAALRQRETTASRESDITSLEWRQRGPGRMAVRFVQRRASDSAPDAVDEASSRVEVDLPALAPHSAGCLDLRAGLTAGSSWLTGPGVNSRISGRVALINGAGAHGRNGAWNYRRGRPGPAHAPAHERHARHARDAPPALLQLSRHAAGPARTGVRSAHSAAAQPRLVVLRARVRITFSAA